MEHDAGRHVLLLLLPVWPAVPVEVKASSQLLALPRSASQPASLLLVRPLRYKAAGGVLTRHGSSAIWYDQIYSATGDEDHMMTSSLWYMHIAAVWLNLQHLGLLCGYISKRLLKYSC